MMTHASNATPPAAGAAPTDTHEHSGESYPALVWRRFRRSRLALVGLAMLLLLVMLSVFAPFFAPVDPTARNSANSYGPPQTLSWYSEEEGFSLRPFVHPYEESFDPVTYQPILEPDTGERIYVTFFARGWEYTWLGISLSRHLIQLEDGSPLHLLGSDALGRDLFSRILFGSRLTLLLGVLVVAVSVTVGTLVGITSGYFGGRKDNLIQRITELFLAFPELPLFLALIAILPQAAQASTLFLLMVGILSILKWAQLAREVRGKALSLAQLDYVKAAIACGASDKRIILRHILPNVMSHVIVVATILIPNVILAESFLSFLGVGIQAPLISLGQLLNAAADFQAVGAYPWLLSPVLFILLAVLAFNAIGDGLRDAIDPYGKVR
ncbi:ABC transporter permease [Halomonas sp. BM-2019]|uniref:ABC transporter permease n=1 Tax=Halomonas sp. BM-2019 TaxID=2811227 RepID=UPI001B3C48B1|nr:MAG: ABC transporter permease [Halomonas sp. BM-2019]